MQVFMFHLMPYAHLDMGFKDKYRAAWVVLPNTLFRPGEGPRALQPLSRRARAAAELGFDGVSVNEHHRTPTG